MQATVATVVIKDNSLAGLFEALNEISSKARVISRNSGKPFGGNSTIHVEAADGLPPHSLELIEETLTDDSKVYQVRFLFVGDV